MILNVLTDSLYTDKEAAVLREYACNAADANVEAGHSEKPIDVRLPNRLDPTLSIRDYGFGMSPDQIQTVFCKLGRSTKRGSNEFTGMLGIGSKAGFAYGDSFLVTSFTNKRKAVYNAYRDQGMPKLAKMMEDTTDQPDGIEVKVPIRQADMHNFITKAERIFRYFRVRPNITGANVVFDDRAEQYAGTGWRYVGNGISVAIMGNVGYTLNAAAMGLTQGAYGSISREETLIGLGIELDFEIGELEIAANREGLQYRDATKKAISARLKTAIDEIGGIFTDKIASAASLWEARRYYHDNFEALDTYNRYNLKRVVDGKIMWKNHVITTGRMNIECVKYDDVAVTKVSRRGDTSSSGAVRLSMHPGASEVQASEKTALVINDLPTKKLSPARMRGHFHTNSDCKDIVVFTFHSEKSQKEFWKEKHLTDAPTIDMSSITPLHFSTAIGGGPSAHKSKHSAKVFVLDETQGQSRPYAARSLWWKTESVDLKKDGGVYVRIEGFKVRKPAPENVFTEEPDTFLIGVKHLRKAGLITGPVYGFKPDRIDKLGPKWVPLEADIKKQMDKLVAKDRFAVQVSDYLAFWQYTRLIDEDHWKLFPNGTPIRRLLEEAYRMRHPTQQTLLELVNSKNAEPWLVKPDLPSASFDLDAQEKIVLQQYKMLNYIDRNPGPDVVKEIVSYVKLVEDPRLH